MYSYYYSTIICYFIDISDKPSNETFNEFNIRLLGLWTLKLAVDKKPFKKLKKAVKATVNAAVAAVTANHDEAVNLASDSISDHMMIGDDLGPFDSIDSTGILFIDMSSIV